MPMWATHYRVPFKPNPFFPVNTLALMRGAAAAQIDGTFEHYHPAIYKAMWVDGRNLNDMAEVAAVLTEAGLDARTTGNRIKEQDVKDRLKATTDEAVARGVFGAPTSSRITWNGPRLQVTQCQPARSAICFTLPASVATLSAKCVAPKPRPSRGFLTKLPPSSPAGCNSVPAG